MSHYDHEELRLHLLTPDSAIAGHVAACADCHERLELTRDFEDALWNPLVWETVAATQQNLSAGGLATARAIEAEDRKAAELLAPSLVSIGAFEEHEVSVRRLPFRWCCEGSCAGGEART